jgi:hypothetical protein
MSENIVNRINELSEKIDSFPKLVSDEFHRCLEKFGINPDDPRETQRLVSWGINAMEKEKQIGARVRNTFSDMIIKGLVLLVIIGFIAFYTQNIVAYITTREKAEIVRIQERTEE